MLFIGTDNLTLENVADVMIIPSFVFAALSDIV